MKDLKGYVLNKKSELIVGYIWSQDFETGKVYWYSYSIDKLQTSSKELFDRFYKILWEVE